MAGIIYGALVALAQTDMKRLIAYSSVSHLGFCMLGLFALNALGVQGGVLQMINHGLSTGGLFAVVGMIYERYHTREIANFGGLARRTPHAGVLHGAVHVVQHRPAGAERFRRRVPDSASACSSGPGRRRRRRWSLAVSKAIAVLAVFGVVLGAWYMLWLVQRVFFGPLARSRPSRRDGTSTSRGRTICRCAKSRPWCRWWCSCSGSACTRQFFLRRMQPTLEPLAAQAAGSRSSMRRAPIVAGRAGRRRRNRRPES